MNETPETRLVYWQDPGSRARWLLEEDFAWVDVDEFLDWVEWRERNEG